MTPNSMSPVLVGVKGALRRPRHGVPALDPACAPGWLTPVGAGLRPDAGSNHIPSLQECP